MNDDKKPTDNERNLGEKIDEFLETGKLSEFLNTFFESLNFIQKIFFFLLIANIFLGVSIHNILSYEAVSDVEDFFSFNRNWLYWATSIVLIFGMYLFKEKADEEE